MPDLTSLVAFTIAAMVVLLIPGPGVLYVVTQSASFGIRAGIVSAVGLSVGVLVHVGAAAVGLSALLLASATAFSIVKMLGAAYLVYLGVRALMKKTAGDEVEPVSRQSLRRGFVDGVVVSALNPKIAVFFLAFLPQFVDPARGGVTQQFVLLGIYYALLALLTDGTYALLAGRLRERMKGKVRGPLPRFMTGGIFIGLGAYTALGGRAD